jgi:hypothetical protein
MLVYDYHEVPLGGTGKWCIWSRPLQWVSASAIVTTFSFGEKFYQLDTATGVADDDLGPIGGYYTFAPIGVTMFQKQYDYLGFRITGSGNLTPFLYPQTLTAAPYTLNIADIASLLDTVAEWPSLNLRGRLLFVKLGQSGAAFALEDLTAMYQSDPNAPISGVR